MPKPDWATKRWMLNAEAHMWRFLMEIGMSLHRLAPPRPMSSSFVRFIPSTLSSAHPGGRIKLVFYVPPDYHTRKDAHTFPVLVNFHGGGMTIGNPEDDATWASAVVEKCACVVVCVGYRLAPTHSFPTPVDDGADAVLWLARHASQLSLDMMRLTVSGFSAGGNLCFTVPLKLATLQNHAAAPSPPPHAQEGGGEEVPLRSECEDAWKVICIIAFYPSVNFTTTRAERRKTNVRQDMNMGEFFTDLFDASYLPPGSDFSHPLLSPGAADARVLQEGICANVLFYTAEWDELQAEARDFAQRLQGLGKRVRYRMMEGQVHAWDRTPNPFKENKLRGLVYTEACAALQKILEGRDMDDLEQRGEHIDDLHIVDNVNEITDEYVKDKDIKQVLGADAPERPDTPELKAMAQNRGA